MILLARAIGGHARVRFAALLGQGLDNLGSGGLREIVLWGIEMKVLRTAGAVGLLVSFSPASAQDICLSPIGSTLLAKSFDQVSAGLPKPTQPKGEFEATADYDARLGAALSKRTQVLVARPVDVQTYPAPLEYDADRQGFKVRATAFDWATTDWSIALRVGEPKGVRPDSLYNVATVINRSTKSVGSYKGTNAFGATASVTKLSRHTDSIWVRPAKGKDDTMFGANGSVLGVIPMQPVEAKASKAKIKFALAITPKPPFLVSGTGLGSSPTFSDRRQIPDSLDFFRVLIADVDCGIVLDGSDKVLAVYPSSK